MENSFMLGIHHGLVFGIVPMAPWIIALKRYLYEGKQKGQIAVAGTIAGQVVFFALTYYGGTEVLQIWYLLEPALFVAGVFMILRVSIELWRRYTSTDFTYGPVRTHREGANLFLASFIFMFCNPWEFSGTQYVFMASIPENVLLYLIGFTLIATVTVVGLWATIGHHIFGKSGPKARILGIYTSKRLALVLTTFTMATILQTNSGQFIHPYTDNVLAYFPQTFDRFKLPMTRGYNLLPGQDPDEEAVAKAAKEQGERPSPIGRLTDARTGKPVYDMDEIEEQKKAAKKAAAEEERDASDEEAFHLAPVGNYNRNQPWTDVPKKALIEKNFWYNIEVRWKKLNELREREILDEDEYKDELRHYLYGGLTPHLVKLRAGIHALLPQPKYERTEPPEYFRQLAQVRHEIDQNLRYLVPPAVRNNYLPYSVDLVGSPYRFELDLRFRDEDNFREKIYNRALNEYELKDIQDQTNNFLNSVIWEFDIKGNRVKPVGSYEQMNIGIRGLELSYIKLHELPAKFRAPWHYTSVPPVKFKTELSEEDFLKMTEEELAEKDKELYKQLTFLNNEPERIPTFPICEVYKRFPHAYRTECKIPYPIGKEVLKTRKALHNRLRREWQETKDYLTLQLPDVEIVRPKRSKRLIRRLEAAERRENPADHNGG